MKKEGFVTFLFEKSWAVRDFLEPLLILPYVFWVFFLMNNGLNWIAVVLGAILFFVVLPSIVFMLDKR